ncbi:endogenous retrovirus group PABLB member 1 Env polyprotein-like [Malaclemys terrapin pileata]|uniref:endogenous retrovirus group PABLB member 1 Env polyprotein-like n=1 Tax=Malaclemys terrapin pileata TaxID=2991368 RepID=UPI0023A912D3|nr:endogenous retrovirus group PABLB member 1 Env polyprotein-like [Malaclemys terrapin pileata]
MVTSSSTSDNLSLRSNCTAEAPYGLHNGSWNSHYNSTLKPQPIRLRSPPTGLICFQQASTSNHTWFAGISTCRFYIGPGISLTVPVLNATGWQTGTAFFALSPQATLRDLQGNNGKASYGEAFWVCGNSAYKWLPHGWHGSCYKGYLAPPLRVLTQAPSGRPRYYRSLRATIEPIREGDRFGIIFLPTYGVGQLTQLYRRLSKFLTQFANNTLAIEKGISSELYQLQLLALQNRQALDYVLASRGGVCALIGEECCTYVPEFSQNINKHILSAKQALNQWKAQEGEPTIFDSLCGWLPGLGELGEGIVRLLLTGVDMFCFFLLLACCKVLIQKICTSYSPEVPLYPLINDPNCMKVNRILSLEYEKTLPKVCCVFSKEGIVGVTRHSYQVTRGDGRP